MFYKLHIKSEKVVLKMILTQVIQQTLNEFLQSGKYESPRKINSGDCQLFAEAVERVMEFENAKMEILNNFDGIGYYEILYEDTDEERYVFNFDWDEFHKYDLKIPERYTQEQLEKLVFGCHYWIYDGNKHYDAECTHGVDSLFELPFFQHWIHRIGVTKKGLIEHEC